MPPPENRNDSEKPAGHVRHDSTGRAIWEWAAESGRHAIDSTSRLLKRLDLPGLTLADDDKKKKELEAQAEIERQAAEKSGVPSFGGSREIDPLGNSKRSFNPYDNRTPVKRSATSPAQRPAARPATPVKKASFFARIFGGKS